MKSVKTLTLGEKIKIAQNKIRQRMQKREQKLEKGTNRDKSQKLQLFKEDQHERSEITQQKNGNNDESKNNSEKNLEHSKITSDVPKNETNNDTVQENGAVKKNIEKFEDTNNTFVEERDGNYEKNLNKEKLKNDEVVDTENVNKEVYVQQSNAALKNIVEIEEDNNNNDNIYKATDKENEGTIAIEKEKEIVSNNQVAEESNKSQEIVYSKQSFDEEYTNIIQGGQSVDVNSSRKDLQENVKINENIVIEAIQQDVEEKNDTNIKSPIGTVDDVMISFGNTLDEHAGSTKDVINSAVNSKTDSIGNNIICNSVNDVLEQVPATTNNDIFDCETQPIYNESNDIYKTYKPDDSNNILRNGDSNSLEYNDVVVSPIKEDVVDIKADSNTEESANCVPDIINVPTSDLFQELNYTTVENINKQLDQENKDDKISTDSSKINEIELPMKLQNDHILTSTQNSKKINKSKEDEFENNKNKESEVHNKTTELLEKTNSNNVNIIKTPDNIESSSILEDSTIALNTESLNYASIPEYIEDNNENYPNLAKKSPEMDLETAAITIQKVFRAFMFRSRASTLDDMSNFDESVDIPYISNEDTTTENENKTAHSEYTTANIINDRRALGITRMDTVLQTVNEEKSLSLSTDDSSTLSSAATTIQAHVRGFLVRNRLNSNKTNSNSSLLNSATSTDIENELQKNKTVLNIHIVPEGGHFESRDESIGTSMDLSFDVSPRSTNLHPLGYDKSERRKQLKREDAIQSVSPPSNNSGKLSEDVDSVKEFPLNNNEVDSDVILDQTIEKNNNSEQKENIDEKDISEETSPSKSTTTDTVIEVKHEDNSPKSHSETRRNQLTKMSSDEMDVVTPYSANESVTITDVSESSSKLLHSGEFHDIILPTRVSRNEASVVRGE